MEDSDCSELVPDAVSLCVGVGEDGVTVDSGLPIEQPARNVAAARVVPATNSRVL